jgi:hypothetical protein
MLPGEMIILMTFVFDARAGKKQLTPLLDISGDNIGNFVNSLVIRGYLKHLGPDGYHLTPTGRTAFLNFLKKSRIRPDKIVTGLWYPGMDLSSGQVQKIAKSEKDIVRAN